MNTDTPTTKLYTPAHPKYPHVEVQLVGKDGNAYAIIGAVRQAMRRADIKGDEIQRYVDEATSGDYNHLLMTSMCWVSVS